MEPTTCTCGDCGATLETTEPELVAAHDCERDGWLIFNLPEAEDA